LRCAPRSSARACHPRTSTSSTPTAPGRATTTLPRPRSCAMCSASGWAAFREGMRDGKLASAVDGKVEVPGFDPTKYLGDKGLRSLDRLTKLLVVSSRLALHEAGLKREG